MKKRLIIGDIHGSGEAFEKVYLNEAPDEVVLLGDYADSFKYDSEKIKESFEAILQIRTLHYANHPKKTFHILLGNHDLHYIINSEKYSGKSWKTYCLMHDLYGECLDKNILNVAYVDYKNRIIFTHAGVTNTWLRETAKQCPLEMLNDISLDYLKFTYGNDDKFSVYGDTIWSSPVWVRCPSLAKDPYIDENGYVWNQIFGHTHLKIPVSFSCGEITEENFYRYPEPDFYKGKFKCLDTFPKFYLVQTLDDDGKLINEEVYLNPDYEYKEDIQ